ncbi:MAG: MOSC domain-containing protein [Acidimicrobiales bacterium]
MWHHTGGQIERCDECRFDASAYTDQDVAGTLRDLTGWVGATVRDIDADTLNCRPAPTVWSPAEYLRHTKRVLWSMALLAETAIGTNGATLDGDPPADASADDPVAHIDVVREVLRVREESMRLLDLWSAATATVKASTLTLNGQTADVAGIVRHALHDATHHVSDMGRGIAALGAGTPAQTGSVASLQASSGVPKHAIPTAEVGYRGVATDRQETRKHHGRVWQALCIWSAEVVEEVAREGHPVSAGAAGENITLAGVDWATLRPGARLEFGEGGVLAETTDWAAPCNTIAHCFTDRHFRRIDAVQHPGSSRIYAKVLRDGTIRPGDPVTVS